jgi:hypothetical protein
MSSGEALIGTVLSQLPKGVELRHIRAHARLRCGVNRSWGETYLIVHRDELLMLTRSSVFDAYELIELGSDSVPRLERGANQSDLFLTQEGGAICRLPVAPGECERVERVIKTYAEILLAE